MQIYIPTRGRVGLQRTWDALPAAIQSKAHLVCLPEEAHKHGHNRVACLPKGTKGISGSRQWVIENCNQNEPVIMLDDDLEFYVAGPARPNVSTDRSLYTPSAFSVMEMFKTLHECVSVGGFAHASVSPREGWNRYPEPWVQNCRYMRVLAYNPKVLNKEGIRFDGVDLMEDFHVNLSLLKKGHASCILTNWAQGQKGSGTEGGCTAIRTPEKQTKAANRLAKLHSPFVKVVQKPSKWGGNEERTDVTVYWKKAYESSIA